MDDDDKTDDNAEDAPAEKRLTAQRLRRRRQICSEPATSTSEESRSRPSPTISCSIGEPTPGQVDDGRDRGGDPGWVLTSSLDVDDLSGHGGRRPAGEIGLTARAGVSFIQQGMRATGSTMTTTTGFNPDNYNIGTSAVLISLGGRITVPYDKNYVLGVEGTLDYASTVFGGIHVAVGTVTADTGISVADFNLRGLAGYDFHKPSGMVLFGRLGFRYRNYAVDGYNDPTKNPALIPQEVLKAPTLGVGLASPRLSDNLGLQAEPRYERGRRERHADRRARRWLDAEHVRRDARRPHHLPLEAGHGSRGHVRPRLRELRFRRAAPHNPSSGPTWALTTTRTDILHTVTFGIAQVDLSAALTAAESAAAVTSI